MSQPTLFETEPIKSEVVVQAAAERMSIWELEDLGNRFVARVVFSGGYDGVLDYLVPAELEDLLESGMRVMVPLGRGNRLTAGYCIDVKFFKDLPQLKDKTLKSIQSIIDNRRLLDDNMIRLTYWISDKYICPLGQVFEAMLPSGVRSNAGTRLTTVLYVAENADKLIDYLKQKNLVQENSVRRISVQKLSAQKNSADTTAQNGSSNLETVLTTKQLHVLATLKNSSQPLTSTELQFAAKCSSAPIDALKRLGLLRAKTIRREKFDSDSLQTTSLVTEPHTLNADQANALAKIKIAVEQHRHKVFLLHGVTGSGKTEVYIQAIREAVSFNRQAIVLVPEISLTPQTVGRFRSRFQNVAVLHSHLTDSERHHQWSIIASGKVQVVVGTRSAVFAPLPNLGLIVIDEEHEGSFKQGTAPRYHARDVACKRAEFEKIPLVLGSATPSIESWYATTVTNSSTQIVHDQNTQQGNDSIIVTNNQMQRGNDSIIVTNNQMQRSNDSIIVTNNQIQRGNDSIIVTNNQIQRGKDSIIVTNNQMREPVNNTIASDDSGGDIQLSCELISMPARVKGLVLPRVEIVDLREEVRAKLTYGAIHRQLHGAIEETIKKNGQVILLLNRRGFSTHLQCPA
ncbi:MAG: DEAD/DEAH box helicase, partial [Planctomycetaceae bacterium]|nr:DEAD/DEAH box helicase [Planctomycetaceae bacterium]